MSISQKLLLMIGVAVAGLLTLSGVWLSGEWSRILAEKQEKCRGLLEVPYSLVVKYHQLEAEGKLSRAEAQGRALDDIRALRYDETNYFWINDLHPTMIMHPVNAKLDGKDLTDIKDPTGKAMFLEMVNVVRKDGGGFVPYMWPKPGKDKPQPKLSYVKEFEPWGWVLGTGIYIDDVDAIRRAESLKAVGVSLASLLVLLSISVIMGRAIVSGLRGANNRIQDIARGDLSGAEIEVRSADEIGKLTEALNKMQGSLRAMVSSVANSAVRIASAGEEFSATSQQITTNSEETSAQANVVSSATEHVNQNLQTVATSSEEIGASISEIAKNAAMAAKVAGEAQKAAADTHAAIGNLNEASQRIGQVVKVINAIARKTDLLALNATVEAARAGAAGSGFAVVANEVKVLAQQTATATEDITKRIAEIQSGAKGAVEAIALISTIVGQVNDFASAVAAAVEEQSATMNEMSRNVTEAAKGLGEVSQNIGGVAQAAQSTSVGAADTHTAAKELALLSTQLHEMVQQFKLSSNGISGLRRGGSAGDFSQFEGRSFEREDRVGVHV